jgi:hypothetical protein
LSELGAYLLAPDKAPAGTKRLTNRALVIIPQAAFRKALRPTLSSRPCWKRYNRAS